MILPIIGYYLGTLKPAEIRYSDRYVIEVSELEALGIDIDYLIDLTEQMDSKLDQLLLEVGKVLTFVDNQIQFNTELREILSNLNTTTIYEIHNETFTEVSKTYIENNTYLETQNFYSKTYNINNDIDIDVDFYVKGSIHHNFYVKCQKKGKQ